MTREEQIISEAKKYYSGDIKCYDAFLHGVEWVEEHQVNVWHDVSEEPQIGSNIVVVDEDGQWWDIQPYDGEYDGYGDLTGWRCCVVHYNNIQSWAYISDLLPKGGEK